MTHRTPAPDGDLSTFARERFESGGAAHDVYRKGSGPAVLILTEIPGISPQVLGFADLVSAIGCTAVLPDLFGTAGRDPNNALYMLRSVTAICVSREFTALAVGRSSPIVTWLRSLAAREHERCGGPGVGVIGMCFTGGFALAMAADPRVLAPVMSQPSLPFGLTSSRKRAVDCAPADLDAIAQRCATEGLRVVGLRFAGDPLVPKERFAYLRQCLGDGFVAVQLAQADGHPANRMPRHHSVLTHSLIDEPGQPTRAARDQVLDLFRNKLLGVRR